MSSPWSREYAESRGPDFDNAVEVTLDEAAPARRTADRVADARPDRPGDRWRPSKALVVGSAALALAVAVAAVVVIGGDDADDTESATATTLDPLLLSDSITTPPTLSPIDTPAPSQPPPGSVAARQLPAAFVSPPEFESVPGVTAEELVQYDLATAVDSNAPNADPVRAMFEIKGPLDDLGDTDPSILEAALSVVATRDPVSQRFALTIKYGESTERTISDRATATVYRSSSALPDDRWVTFAESEVLEGTGTDDLDELYDSMVTGPITAELLATAKVTPSEELFRLDGGAFARRYEISIAADAIDPVGVLMFAGAAESMTDIEGGDTIEFQVYVTSQPALALVTSLFAVNGEPRTFMQTFDRRPANVRIDLPSADELISTPNTSATTLAP